MVPPRFDWKLRNRTLALGGRTVVMGIVNVTPDSFSDGGQFGSSQAAVEHALRLLDEGAAILDIGGESTRPGSKAFFHASGERTGFGVSAEEELARVLPVIDGVLRAQPGAVISVDTYKAEVARRAVEHGAEIVNDVSGGVWDSQMYATVAELGCGYILMHMRGQPDTWRKLPKLEDPLGLVLQELRERAQLAKRGGVARESLVMYPGFGFGKSFEENYPLLNGFERFHELGLPVLSGTSRKSFLGKAIARDGVDAPVHERMYASVAAAVVSAWKGAHIVRVHDVEATVDAVRVVEAITASN
jgi:dihydropteroate synthase